MKLSNGIAKPCAGSQTTRCRRGRVCCKIMESFAEKSTRGRSGCASLGSRPTRRKPIKIIRQAVLLRLALRLFGMVPPNLTLRSGERRPGPFTIPNTTAPPPWLSPTRFIQMASCHSDKTSGSIESRTYAWVTVLGIVDRPGCHSPDRSFRIGVTTTKNRKAKGSNIAGDNHLDGFSARRSRRHRSRIAKF